MLVWKRQGWALWKRGSFMEYAKELKTILEPEKKVFFIKKQKAAYRVYIFTFEWMWEG